MKPETSFSRQLVNMLKMIHPGDDLQIVRIESNYTQQGIPDIYLCLQGVSTWIETKVDNNPLEPLQVAWHRQHRSAGGVVLVVREKVSEGGQKYYTVENREDFHVFNSIYELVSYISVVLEERKLCLD